MEIEYDTIDTIKEIIKNNPSAHSIQNFLNVYGTKSEIRQYKGIVPVHDVNIMNNVDKNINKLLKSGNIHMLGLWAYSIYDYNHFWYPNFLNDLINDVSDNDYSEFFERMSNQAYIPNGVFPYKTIFILFPYLAHKGSSYYDYTIPYELLKNTYSYDFDRYMVSENTRKMHLVTMGQLISLLLCIIHDSNLVSRLLTLMPDIYSYRVQYFSDNVFPDYKSLDLIQQWDSFIYSIITNNELCEGIVNGVFTFDHIVSILFSPVKIR